MGRRLSCFDRRKNNEIKGNFWVKSRKGVIFRNMKGEGFSCERPHARLFLNFPESRGEGEERKKKERPLLLLRFWVFFFIFDFQLSPLACNFLKKKSR